MEIDTSTSKEFKQFNLEVPKKSLQDFFTLQGNRLIFNGVMQTPNFIMGRSGAQISSEGIISGNEISIITGNLQHTGTKVGFYNTAPIAQQTVTFGNTNGEISGLTISAIYSQAEVQALRDKCEELADDCRNLRSAVAALGLII